MRLRLHAATLALTLSILAATANAESAGTPTGPFGLDLPDYAVSDRVSITRGIGANRRETWAELDGLGCINHIWITLKHPKQSDMANRKTYWYQTAPVRPFVKMPEFAKLLPARAPCPG